MGPTADTFLGNEPIFNPTYLNIEYFFYRLFHLGSGFREFWQDNETIIKIIAYTISAFLLAIAIYSCWGIIRIWKHEWEELEHEAHGHGHSAHAGDHQAHGAMHEEHSAHEESAQAVYGPATPAGHEWDRVIDLASSANENDWRQAIIEADIVLDRLLDHLGYTGAEVGEKLRSAQIGDFVTLDAAWEAHKVRNKIAHEGLAFNLARREAIRVLGLYEKVFREFSFI